MRVCLATNGTHGDVFPFIAVGRELASRGHEVWVLTHPYFERDCAAAGLGFYPMAPRLDMESIIRHPDLFRGVHGSRMVLRWLAAGLPDGVESFREMLGERRPDVLVSHNLMLGGMEVCARERVRFVNVSLVPCTWVARDDPCPVLQRRPGRAHASVARLAGPAARWGAGVLTDRLLSEPAHRAGLRERGGLLFRSMRDGELNLGLWSSHLRPPCADDPAGGVIVGFACYDGVGGLGQGLERFLGAGEPPVVFAMGSAAHHTAGRFYERACAVCERLGVRGVLLTGDPGRAPAGLPETVFASGYAPFSALFPRALATVHHGGIGSVAQALRAGRPTLVVARAHDQFNNAAHVDRLGVGRALAFSALTERRLARVLGELIGDASIARRAGEMGERLAVEDGARVAADYVEAFCRGA